LFTRVLTKAEQMTASWGGRLYLVYLPSQERYISVVDQQTFMHRDRVLTIAQQLNIPTIEIHEAFMRHEDPLSLIPFRGRGHFTKEGYRLIAEAIATYLESDLPATVR
jgi:hypothetical protein